jgi:IS30 family transposase
VEGLLRRDWSPEQAAGYTTSSRSATRRSTAASGTIERNAIAKHLNTRPRKRYGYDTPEERFHAA